MTAILGALGIFAVLIFCRPFTTLVHELGHALPALVFTKKEVIIYVGSYGDIENSWHFKIGRLYILFTPRIIDLQLGLCQHHPASSNFKTIAIILGGPIFSLLLGLVCSLLIISYQEQQYLAFVLAILLTSGIFDFLVNIIPSKDTLALHDGTYTHNDGYQFMQAVQTYRYPPVYFEALEHLQKDEMELAIEKFFQTAESGIMTGPLYEQAMLILAFPEKEDDDEIPYLSNAIDFHEKYNHQFKLDSHDFMVAGMLYEKVDNDLKAISHYSKAVELNYLNAEARFLRAKLFHKLGYEDRALTDLKRVIALDESHQNAKDLLASISG